MGDGHAPIARLFYPLLEREPACLYGVVSWG